MNYYGNHVYGNGEAQPYHESNETALHECCLCYEEFEDENKVIFVNTIQKIVCKHCLMGEPKHLLTYLHMKGGINPVKHPKECLRLNDELLSIGYLNLPVFPYMQGRHNGINYNIELIHQYLEHDRRRRD